MPEERETLWWAEQEIKLLRSKLHDMQAYLHHFEDLVRRVYTLRGTGTPEEREAMARLKEAEALALDRVRGKLGAEITAAFRGVP